MANNSKHIFIGIGGSGCQTVSQIKEKVYEKRYPHPEGGKSRLEAMNDTYRFIFLDTDQRDIDEANRRNRNSFEHGRVPFINPQTDLVNLGRANPLAIYYEATHDKTDTLINKRILEACSPELAAKIPDQPLAFGAGAFRMKSRIAFAHSLADFQTKLQAAISGLNDVKTVGGAGCTIFYWVVGSSVGGTGSGMFNDVLYHLNMLHHQIVGDGDPQLVYTMYMPKFFIDANATEEKYALNAFGVLQEVTAFKKMSYDPDRNTVMHRLAFLNDYNLVDAHRRYCPFYYMIPIDIQTDKGTSLGTTRTMYRNTAEMLYHLHNGQGGDTFRSDIDNYMNDIMEKNHENFLVPMGYVSLHKPNEQFREYMRARFKRDLVQNWLLNLDEKVEDFKDDDKKKLYNVIFKELNIKDKDSIAATIAGKTEDLEAVLDSSDQSGKPELKNEHKIDNVEGVLNEVIENISKHNTKQTEYKAKIVSSMWKQAESMIREHGLSYTVSALSAVHEYANKKYTEISGDKISTLEEEIDKNLEPKVRAAYSEANTYTTKEKILGGQQAQVDEYMRLVKEWADKKVELAIDKWSVGLLKDFCTDEKNDEISKLRIYLSRLADKAADMTAKAKKDYNSLSNKLGNAALDVTTVYLPQLKEICDGSGWKSGNFFSELYKYIFVKCKDDKEESPDRAEIASYINDVIYSHPTDELVAEMKKGQYVFYPENAGVPKDKQQSDDYRFFANPNLSDRASESLIEGFLTCAEIAFDHTIATNPDIQDKWENKKISDFFDGLSNDKKDEVRRALNPALFFNYNSSRIEVTKKEEHVVFVANNEDMAREMLGYEKGNPKHRFESDPDINKALVLKSKFGLSLKDYRIYDSLKVVYDKATFREKYFFHHDFAQHLDQLTLSNLPAEELPQHRSFAKMLLLNKFIADTAEFFYKDEFFEENYPNSMFSENEKGSYFEIAGPDAYQGLRNGKLCLCKDDKGRILYEKIIGKTFVERFGMYCELYFNHRYGETLERLLAAILQQKLDGGKITGEQVLADKYDEKRKELLIELKAKVTADGITEEERLIYRVLFQVIREKFSTVQDFLSNHK